MIEKMKFKNISVAKDNIRGVTLIALMITLIVLLILGNVTIVALSGDNGILKQSAEAKINSKVAGYQESINLSAQNLAMNGVELEDEEYVSKLENVMGYYDNLEGTTAKKLEDQDEITIEVKTPDNYIFWITENSVKYKPSK